MVNMLQLPAYNPGNALDFSSLNNAIDSNRQNALMQSQLGMQKERNMLAQQQFGLQQQEFGLTKRKSDQEHRQSQFKEMVGLAQATAAEKDPVRRKALHDRLMAKHPENATLPDIYRDPVRGPEIILQEAQGFNMDEFGKQGAVMQNPDGTFSAVQFGSRGTIRKHDFSPGMEPARGVKTVDEGTGTRVISGASGRDVRGIAKDVAGEAGQKVIGKETAELQFSLPKARASMESANAKVGIVRSKIDQALPMVSNWTVGQGSYLANLPATQARNLREIANTIVANLGFDELQEMRANSPTGGALGQVAVQELEMLQKAKTSLDQAQTVEQYKAALNELKSIYDGAVERRQRAFGETYAPLMNQRTGNSPHVTGPREPRQFTDRLPQGGPQQPGSQGMIPPQAVMDLRSDPSPVRIQQFEQVFGPGSARQFLGAR